MLSNVARKSLPISIECKSRKAFALYKDYEQAEANSEGYQPVLIIKQNRSIPLAVMDLDYYLALESQHEEKKPNS